MIKLAVRGLSVSLLVAHVLGCKQVQEEKKETPQETIQSKTAALLAAAQPELIKVGQLDKMSPEQEDYWRKRLEHPGDQSASSGAGVPDKLYELSVKVQEIQEQDSERFYTMRLDLNTGEVYGVAYPKAAVSELSRMVAPEGWIGSSETGQEEEVVEKGFSNGIDNRIWAGPTCCNGVQYSSAGRFTSPIQYCTGNLFSRNHIWTAAHCFINESGQYTWPYTFTPRQVGTAAPYGTATADYAEWPTGFTLTNCHKEANLPNMSCVQYDFAVVQVPSNSFSPNPGYVGFSNFYDSDLQNKSPLRHIGYPGCGRPHSPANCRSENPYLDPTCANAGPILSFGGATSNYWPSDGHYSVMSTGCDVSQGQSGGAVLDTNNVILAALTRDACVTTQCYPTQTYSSDGRRINQPMFDWMMVFRQSSP